MLTMTDVVGRGSLGLVLLLSLLPTSRLIFPLASLRRSSKPYETFQATVHDLVSQKSMRSLNSRRSSEEPFLDEDVPPVAAV